MTGPTDHPELLEWVQTIGWGSFCDKRTDPLCLQAGPSKNIYYEYVLLLTVVRYLDSN